MIVSTQPTGDGHPYIYCEGGVGYTFYRSTQEWCTFFWKNSDDCGFLLRNMPVPCAGPVPPEVQLVDRLETRPVK